MGWRLLLGNVLLNSAALEGVCWFYSITSTQQQHGVAYKVFGTVLPGALCAQ